MEEDSLKEIVDKALRDCNTLIDQYDLWDYVSIPFGLEFEALMEKTKEKINNVKNEAEMKRAVTYYWIALDRIYTASPHNPLKHFKEIEEITVDLNHIYLSLMP